jgi:hypothetical protein
MPEDHYGSARSLICPECSGVHLVVTGAASSPEGDQVVVVPPLEAIKLASDLIYFAHHKLELKLRLERDPHKVM